jgi:hypothetical protein
VGFEKIWIGFRMGKRCVCIASCEKTNRIAIASSVRASGGAIRES